MTTEHSDVNKSHNSLMTCLQPELCSWPCAPVKCLSLCPYPRPWKNHMGAHSAVQQRDLGFLVCGHCTETLCGLSAGTMQATVLFDCTAVNLSNISAASSACTLGRIQPPLTGDLNVFVYWRLTPTNRFSTMRSHSGQETPRAFAVLVCYRHVFCCLYALHSWCKIQFPYFSPS